MKNFKIFFKKNRVIIFSYFIALLLFSVVTVIRPGFGSASHVRVIIMDAAILGIIALGQTLVIISGGIDLSIPWTVTSSAIFFTILVDYQGLSILLVAIIILGCTTLIGLLNGLGVAYLGIPPIIMTLGMNYILLGGLVGMMQGAHAGTAPDLIKFLAVGNLGPIPVIFLIWIVIAVIATIIMTFTPYGRQLYAVGNNEIVALFSGIKVANVKLLAYCIAGLASGLGGILLVGRIGQAYLGMGDPFLFYSVIVVVIGGAAIVGGSGHYLGTIAGAFLLTILNGLLPAFKLPASRQQIIYGIVLLIAVVLTRSRTIDNI